MSSLSPSNGVPLTESLILQKTKLENLQAVKNVNLWGCEINDLSILSRLPNLEVLTLSVNNVSTLKDLGACKSLREIYLRKNEVSNLSEVQHLSGLSHLKTLWLNDNPCASHPLYRQFTLYSCPSLQQLDNTPVTAAEREQARRMTSTQVSEIMTANSNRTGAAAVTATTAPRPSSSSDNNNNNRPPAPLGNNSNLEIGSNTSKNVPPPPPPRPLHQAPSTSSVVVPQQQVQQKPSSASSSSLLPSRSTQKAIVSSILTLLGELGPESLDFLKNDIDRRLVNSGRK